MILTIIFIALVLWLTFAIRHSRKKSESTWKSYYDRERDADMAENRDIRNLQYITIPFEKFPLNFFENTDNEDYPIIIDELKQLGKTRLLNLNGKSNTDLKLEYGPANLTEMQEIGDRFSRVCVLLTDLAKCFLEEGNPAGAAAVLEYGSEIGSDISTNYTLLGECYQKLGESDKFDALCDHVRSMDFLMRDAVLKELSDMKK
ncbi:MAG: hypothetical protein DUD27_03660 [Lachnospiraceae bacterium]|uniref:Tetratricopeptide repeat protein n=1 Tax=Candidatus Weimeria bifida TaxID=2599074 RepID=A0A6N7J095_9FIRM|nr:hypothetical protein [Candidatus Weimeria bifida]RRF96714.1 MAG: hypothetical protein DUD27_03660 [Lachnospiraceae bacterium]